MAAIASDAADKNTSNGLKCLPSYRDKIKYFSSFLNKFVLNLYYQNISGKCLVISLQFYFSHSKLYQVWDVLDLHLLLFTIAKHDVKPILCNLCN